MRFGTPVLVTRGGSNPAGTPGCTREVRGILVGAIGKHTRIVRLTQDDPLATCGYCLHSGDIGHWSTSAIRPLHP
jgi:hypothetical protein